MNQPSTESLSPDEVYRSLLRSLRRRRGFGLMFVQCTPARATQLIEEVQEELPQKTVGMLTLTEPVETLYDRVATQSDLTDLNFLFIQGLEKSLEADIKPGYGGEGDYYNVNTVPPILAHLNQQRERFRHDFNHCCFVFLLPVYAIKYFVRRAPDFFDWGNGIFELRTNQDTVALESSRLFDGYNKYITWTQRERDQRILDIQIWLTETQDDLERQASLFFEQGNVFAASQQDEEAIASYDQGIAIQPDNHEAWANRGYSLDDLGRREEAIASYDQAIEINPDNEKAWYNRGISLVALDRREEAIASYDKTTEINPDNEKAWTNRGISLDALGRREEAIASYDKAIKIKPDCHQAWYNRGNALDALGRREEAIASYDKAIKIKPDYHQAWANRGASLNDLDRREEAIASYDQAIAIKPDLPEAWYSKACCFSLMKQLDQALELLRKAIQLDSKCQEMAKTDEDFAALRDDPRFWDVVGEQRDFGV